MRQCYSCWTNLKNEPANLLHKKNTNEAYLLCNKCKNKKYVSTLLDTGRWEIIYNTPTTKKGE